MKRMAAITILMFGCATYAPPGSVHFQEGYVHGCTTGEMSAGNPWRQYTKEPYRYENTPDYRSGWDDGFMICKGKYEALSRRY